MGLDLLNLGPLSKKLEQEGRLEVIREGTLGSVKMVRLG